MPGVGYIVVAAVLLLGGVALFFLFRPKKSSGPSPALNEPILPSVYSNQTYAQKGPALKIFCAEGKAKGETYYLSAMGGSIGKASKNDISLEDADILDHHVEIRPKAAGEYWVKSVDPSQPFSLNSKQSTEAKISNEDTLSLGKTKLTLFLIKQ